MDKQKIKIGLLIVTVLVVAFFWGGNKEVNPLTVDELGKDSEVVEDLDIENEENWEDNKEVEEDLSKDEIGENEDDANKEEIKEKKIKEDKEIKKKIIEKDKENKAKQDKNSTDPVPEGKPDPVEPENVEKDTNEKLTATLSVTCKSILNNMDMFNMDKIDVLPDDGIIYATKTITFSKGESAFDVLLREMQANKIHIEFTKTPVYNSHYVEGINNLYEFDCGELSGWRFKVNGWYPNYGASRYELKDGDKIEWIYSCDLGRDIGVGFRTNGDEE